MLLDYIIRRKCAVTEKADLESLYTIKGLPVFIGCTDQPKKEDKREDMEVSISRSSGIIQLRKLLPLSTVYSSYHSEGVGKVWENHYKYFSNFVTRHTLSNNIVEMGGSNTRLAELCFDINKKLNWTIVEPNPNPLHQISNKNIKIVSKFIEDQLDLMSNGSTFVHSHTLEHLYEPFQTLKAITKKSQLGDRMIFSVPDLYKYLKNKFVNAINFEHTCFLTEEVIDFLMEKLGYEIIEKYHYQEHSIFYAVKFVGHSDNGIKKKDLNYYAEYKDLYLEFIKYIKNEVTRLNEVIENHHKTNGKQAKIYLFGAHIFSQFLINFGLMTNKIDGIIDNSINKKGKRLYGTDLYVMSPNVVKENNTMVIIKAGQYQFEIESQLKQISESVKIIN